MVVYNRPDFVVCHRYVFYSVTSNVYCFTTSFILYELKKKKIVACMIVSLSLIKGTIIYQDCSCKINEVSLLPHHTSHFSLTRFQPVMSPDH